MATLLEILGEDLNAQVEAKINEHNAGIEDKLQHVRFTDLSEGKFVSVEKFNATQTQFTDTKALLDTANAEIKSYQDMDIDGIKAAAGQWEDKYKTDIQAMQDKLDNQEKAFAADKFLSGQGFKSKLAQKAAAGDLMGLEFKDGAFVGAEDFIKKLKEEDPDSFVAKDPDPEPEPPKGPQSWTRPTGRSKRPMSKTEEQSYLEKKYANNKFYGK